ncbi:hypothetical protein JCM17845_14280 [Iodidimonas gelatinilytica]|uniref:Uncharacterized protein n=1 Tax=Iodidimonas gelatinilytica TaxID=1236966 RepID=A0A5A7MZC9_9PROT|nr:hypothetical protein [Iodidimonas gelatinilytica]GER00805.1 hypothetical protein JCM17845_14280 [Iodidimonas gelatinilytica]
MTNSDLLKTSEEMEEEDALPSSSQNAGSDAREDDYLKIPEGVVEKEEALSATSQDMDSGAREAEQISQALDEKEIKKRAAANEHNRNEKFRDNFELYAIMALWVTGVVILLLLITWALHILLPEEFHWLSSSQLEKVEHLSIGGIIASLGVGHIKKRLGH